jgi:hypothetical protein
LPKLSDSERLVRRVRREHRKRMPICALSGARFNRCIRMAYPRLRCATASQANVDRPV